jgi:CheY-like chemotaxis protein
MKTIIVASGNTEILDNVPKYLSLLGYKVKPVSNAEEVIQLAASIVSVDLMIIEVKPLSTTGLVEKIRESVKMPELPIIGIVDSNINLDDNDLFTSILRKPFKLKALGQEVLRVLPML